MHNIRDFGAIGDGLSHPVSSVYPDWQVRFPHATSPNDEVDWCAIQAAINAVPKDGGTVFVPPGQYIAGDIVIQKPVIFEGSWAPRNLDILSSIQVPPEKVGIVLRRFVEEVRDPDGNPTCRDHNPTGTIIRKLNIIAQSKLTKDGIHVFGVNGFKIENVHVENFGGNGISIHGPGTDDSTPVLCREYPGGKPIHYFNSNNWQIENCATYGCGANGLLVEGRDANAGLCVSLSTIGNQGWGICEKSFLGNTYVACYAEANVLGSYVVFESANYSSFLSCYQEADNVADFSRSPYILVVGGNLSYDHRRILKDENNVIQEVKRIGAEDRVGYFWSRLNFREQIAFREKVPFNEIPGGWIPAENEPEPGDERTLSVTIPDLPYYLYAAALTFTYYPTMAGRQFWRDGKFEPDRPKEVDGTFVNTWNTSSWLLARYTQDYTNEANYDPQSPDRTWIVGGTPTETDPYVIPFGWTDRQHPLGPGHLFFWNALANQRAHWTVRVEIDQEIPIGGMWLDGPKDGQKQVWLEKAQRAGASVMALFSLEAQLADVAESLPLSIGPHQIFDDGTFKVWISNHSGAGILPAMPPHVITLIAHFELYLEWPHP